MFDFVGVLILVILIGLFLFLLIRSWGSKRAWLKWPGLVLSGLLTLIFALALVASLIGFSKLNAKPNNPVSNVKVQGTPEQIARGAKFANFCAGCHSSTQKPPLDGGAMDFAAEGPPVGTMYPPNLTPAGPLKDWSDGEIIRAIREGIHKDGRPLLIMPSDTLHNFSDADVQAVVAYLRSQPPIQHDLPDVRINALGAIFLGAGIFPTSAQPTITQPIVAPPAGPTADYGKYLVSISACQLCHGQDFAGGTKSDFGPPAGPNLTALVPKMSEAEFVKTIRTGVNPSGKSLNPVNMPWKELSATYNDDELKAVFAYLKGLKLIDKSVK